ncbi:MAG: carbon monoxide dehydrogenase [Candidatus Sumerlaeota bacterium]|nr:carbon monoxide dehydrogenase [Candidatus Sumerlaeota bacterium]
MSHLIAISGKGGTGKSTVAACLVRLLLENGKRPVLAVDADPNHTLAPLLGLQPGPTIGDIRDEVLESKARTTGVPKERLLEMKLEECVQEASGFDLITMGRPEGPSCYCYVNNLLRGALKGLRSNYRATIVDNAAGMEHLSRMNTDAISCLALVSEPTLTSARAVARILELAASLPVRIERRALIWNKVLPDGVPAKVSQACNEKDFDRVAFLPFDAGIGRLSALEENALAAPPLPEAFRGLLEACGMSARRTT